MMCAGGATLMTFAARAHGIGRAIRYVAAYGIGVVAAQQNRRAALELPCGVARASVAGRDSSSRGGALESAHA